METKCCQSEGFECYGKDSGWAQCMETCGEQEDQKDWSCEILKPTPEIPIWAEVLAGACLVALTSLLVWVICCRGSGGYSQVVG